MYDVIPLIRVYIVCCVYTRIINIMYPVAEKKNPKLHDVCVNPKIYIIYVRTTYIHDVHVCSTMWYMHVCIVCTHRTYMYVVVSRSVMDRAQTGR